MKTTQTIDYSEAKQIVDLIVGRALAMQKAAVVAVADSHGELIAFARMDGAPVSSIRMPPTKPGRRRGNASRPRTSGRRLGTRKRAMTLPTTAIPSLWEGAAAFQCGENARWWAPWP
jgi:Haem-degrading